MDVEGEGGKPSIGERELSTKASETVTNLNASNTDLVHFNLASHLGSRTSFQAWKGFLFQSLKIIKHGLAYSTFSNSIYQNFEDIQDKLTQITPDHLTKAKTLIDKIKPHFHIVNRNMNISHKSADEVENSLTFLTRWFSSFMFKHV